MNYSENQLLEIENILSVYNMFLGDFMGRKGIYGNDISLEDLIEETNLLIDRHKPTLFVKITDKYISEVRGLLGDSSILLSTVSPLWYVHRSNLAYFQEKFYDFVTKDKRAIKQGNK